jgi:quercetin dioxygenase-like cupin family protein
MKRIIIILAGFLLLTSLTLAGVAQATPPSHLKSTTLGRIHLGPFHESSDGFTISARHPTDVVVLTTTIRPGGSTGWHSHPGPAFIVVIRGTLTVYDGNDPACTPHRYRSGTGFLDPGFGHVHIARNEGRTPVTVVQTYLNVPLGGSPRIDKPRPGNCPF